MFRYRELLASPEFVDFMRKVKPVEVVPVVMRNKHPIVRGEYTVHGGAHAICVKNLPPAKVLEYMHYLRNRRGFKAREWAQGHITQRPSIQGLWFPGWRPPPSTAPPPTRHAGFSAHLS
jgi:hypothetical protein